MIKNASDIYKDIKRVQFPHKLDFSGSFLSIFLIKAKK